MGTSGLQKNFVLVIECTPLTINDRACNYFACKNNEYSPFVYNGTFGKHHFCVETVPMSIKTNAHQFCASLFLLTSVLFVVMFSPNIVEQQVFVYSSSCSYFAYVLPSENAVVNKHAARHWLSTFLFASKVPLLT